MNATHRQRLWHIRSVIEDNFTEIISMTEEKVMNINDHEDGWIQTNDGLREIIEINRLHSTVACLLEAAGNILRIISTK